MCKDVNLCAGKNKTSRNFNKQDMCNLIPDVYVTLSYLSPKIVFYIYKSGLRRSLRAFFAFPFSGAFCLLDRSPSAFKANVIFAYRPFRRFSFSYFFMSGIIFDAQKVYLRLDPPNFELCNEDEQFVQRSS